MHISTVQVTAHVGIELSQRVDVRELRLGLFVQPRWWMMGQEHREIEAISPSLRVTSGEF
jgi:hypothetical protein